MIKKVLFFVVSLLVVGLCIVLMLYGCYVMRCDDFMVR